MKILCQDTQRTLSLNLTDIPADMGIEVVVAKHFSMHIRMKTLITSVTLQQVDYSVQVANGKLTGVEIRNVNPEEYEGLKSWLRQFCRITHIPGENDVSIRRGSKGLQEN